MGKRAEVRPILEHFPKRASQKSGNAIFYNSIYNSHVLGFSAHNMQVFMCLQLRSWDDIMCFQLKVQHAYIVKTDCIAVITQTRHLKFGIWELHVRTTLHYTKNVKPICKLLSGKNTSAYIKNIMCNAMFLWMLKVLH